MLKNYIKIENSLLCSTKCYIVLFCAVLVSAVISYAANYSEAASDYSEYCYMENFYEENGDETENTDEYALVESDDGNVTIENPLAYYKEKIIYDITALSPEYSVTWAMEWSMVVFPLIFGILGLYMGSVDYRYHILKHKISRSGRDKYWMSKTIITVVVSIIAAALYVIVCMLCSVIISNFVLANEMEIFFDVESAATDASFVWKILFLLILSVIYALAGFCLGVIFKTLLPGLMVILLYSYAVPCLGKFDLSNSLSYIAGQLGCGYGVVSFTGVKSTSAAISVMVILVFVLISGLASYIVTKRRSAFN